MQTKEFDLNGPLSTAKPAFEGSTRLGKTLRNMLDQSNGSSAYGGAFVLLPSGGESQWWTMEEFNAGSWKASYSRKVQETWFFAVDTLGFPFGILGEEVVHLNPETGHLKPIAFKLGEFLEAVESDPDTLVRLDLFDAWCQAGEGIGTRERLAPKTPIMLGGGKGVEDLYAADLMERMDFNAELHSQTKDMPEGTQVTFKLTR